MQVQRSEILADSRTGLLTKSRLSVLVGLATLSLVGVVTATAVVPGDDSAPAFSTSVLEQLPTPALETLPSPDVPYVFDERIQPGDNLQAIFQRLGIEDPEALSFILKSDEGKDALRRMRAGRSVVALIHGDGTLKSFSLPIASSDERLVLERTDAGELNYASRDLDNTDTLVELRSGVITHSLFGATDAAGVPDAVASKFAEIFGTQIDFTRDLREGDRFSVIYETVFDQGKPVGSGRILAAEFVNQGKTHVVVRYREADGNEAYYTPDGRGLNQAFLRYPLEFSRVSSSFGRRLHPIHKSWRSHNGTDFAAPRGTPIMASSDGRIRFVGNQRGYGKTIIIDHKDRYSSLYAHLNGFAKGVSNGQRVRQGEIIGYVGSTGWATGPHLHYEIRINNVPHDPMKIALPTVQPLEKNELAVFKEKTQPVLEQLALLDNTKPRQLADASR